MNRSVLLLMALCVSVMVSAEVFKFQATSISSKYFNEYGYWSEWSEWENCNILVVINSSAKRINIYSSVTQEYDIYDSHDVSYDNDGGQTATFNCIDADGLRCDIRLRSQSDGQIQLYVDYNNFMFVYNIESK